METSHVTWDIHVVAITITCHVRLASLNTIADLWSAWLLLGVIGGVVVRGVANGDTIVHWLLGDSVGENTGVSNGDDVIDDTSVVSSSSVRGNFLRVHGNTTGRVSSCQTQCENHDNHSET